MGCGRGVRAAQCLKARRLRRSTRRCAAKCLDHLLVAPHGAAEAPGALLYDGLAMRRWGYTLGGMIVVNDGFLAREPALVQKIVERVSRANYDYGADPGAAAWTTGRYIEAAGVAFSWVLGQKTVPPQYVRQLLESNSYPPVAAYGPERKKIDEAKIGP